MQKGPLVGGARVYAPLVVALLLRGIALAIGLALAVALGLAFATRNNTQMCASVSGSRVHAIATSFCASRSLTPAMFTSTDIGVVASRC